jgi:activator of HSP90 ATPase
MSGAIRQTVTIKADAQRVYDALTDGAQFSKLTGGAPATIEAHDGGAFSCFGGMIIGRNIELRSGARIVQAWRAGTWPEGRYSIVKLDLTSSDAETTVTLEHMGFPEDARAHLEGGWHKMYWDPLKAHLA